MGILRDWARKEFCRFVSPSIQLNDSLPHSPFCLVTQRSVAWQKRLRGWSNLLGRLKSENDIITLTGNFDRIFNSNKKHVRASIDDIFISLVKLDNLPPYKIYEDFCPLTEKKKTKTKKKNKKKTDRPSIWIALCVRVAITYCIISDVDCKNKADVSTYKFQRY